MKVCPVAILDIKLMKKKKIMVVGLIMWFNSFFKDAISEELEKIKMQFSKFLCRFLRIRII